MERKRKMSIMVRLLLMVIPAVSADGSFDDTLFRLEYAKGNAKDNVWMDCVQRIMQS